MSGGRLVQSIWCGLSPALMCSGYMYACLLYFLGARFVLLNLSYVVCFGSMCNQYRGKKASQQMIYATRGMNHLRVPPLVSSEYVELLLILCA